MCACRLKVKKLTEHGFLPVRGSNRAAGYDLKRYAIVAACLHVSVCLRLRLHLRLRLQPSTLDFNPTCTSVPCVIAVPVGFTKSLLAGESTYSEHKRASCAAVWGGLFAVRTMVW